MDLQKKQTPESDFKQRSLDPPWYWVNRSELFEKRLQSETMAGNILKGRIRELKQKLVSLKISWEQSAIINHNYKSVVNLLDRIIKEVEDINKNIPGQT